MNAMDVKALLDKRLQRVRALGESRARVMELRKGLREATRDDALAYQAALKDGWSVRDLKLLGFDEPTMSSSTRAASHGGAEGNAT